MIDLKVYYGQTAYKNEYYIYEFGLPYRMSVVNEYYIFDDEDAIKRFKELVMPYNPSNPIIDLPEDEKFIYLCNYLLNIGYCIKEFPDFLKRPTSRWEFSYDIVREKIIEESGYNGSVRWADRKTFINSLKFERIKLYDTSKDIKKILKKISTRNIEFEEMAIDEKLKEICNCIEYLLKKDKKFIEINYDNSCNYLSNEIVLKYRKKLECFRHSSKESLKERNKYIKEQKEFLINYGVLIINFIQVNINNIVDENINIKDNEQ